MTSAIKAGAESTIHGLSQFAEHASHVAEQALDKLHDLPRPHRRRSRKPLVLIALAASLLAAVVIKRKGSGRQSAVDEQLDVAAHGSSSVLLSEDSGPAKPADRTNGVGATADATKSKSPTDTTPSNAASNGRAESQSVSTANENIGKQQP